MFRGKTINIVIIAEGITNLFYKFLVYGWVAAEVE